MIQIRPQVMDIAVQNTSPIVRIRDMAVAPEGEAPGSARMGTVAPQLQVPPPVEVNPVQREPKDRPGAEHAQVVPIEPAASLSDEPESHGPALHVPANRYKYKVAHEPDLDRPLLQIVDEKTDQIILSLPPEQLARMLEDAKALIEDRLREPQVKRLDTLV